MTAQLNQQTVTTTFNVTPTFLQGSGGFRFEVPQSSVTMPKPLSYDFRVAEYVDKKGNVVRVGLQYRIWEHDNYGAGAVIQDWIDVERIKVELP